MGYRKQLLLVLALLATSGAACGKAPVTDVGPFGNYTARFEQVSGQYSASPVKVQNVVLQFGETEPNERGVCVMADGQTPTVTINETTWSTIPETEREELIFHELGHCILGRVHTVESDPNGKPSSIMAPYRILGDIYESNREYYLSELFAVRNQI